MGENKVVQQKFDAQVNAQAGDDLQFVPRMADGQPTPLLDASQFDPEATQLYVDYMEITQDFEDSATALSQLISTPDNEEYQVVRRALIVDGIMGYARPFSKNFGRKIRLEGTEEWIGSSENDRKLHNEIVDLRNKLIAHTDDSPYRIRNAAVIVDSVSDPKIVHGIYFLKVAWFGLQNEEVQKIRDHVNSVLNRVQSKASQIADAITHKAKQAVEGS